MSEKKSLPSSYAQSLPENHNDAVDVVRHNNETIVENLHAADFDDFNAK